MAKTKKYVPMSDTDGAIVYMMPDKDGDYIKVEELREELKQRIQIQQDIMDTTRFADVNDVAKNVRDELTDLLAVIDTEGK